MRILLTESTTGAASLVERELRAAGYDVVLCHSEPGAAGDCIAIAGQSSCPLHTGPVDLVVDVKEQDGPLTGREFGASCAVRNNIPLVVAGPAEGDGFPWSDATVICTPATVIEGCEAAVFPIAVHIAGIITHAACRCLRATGLDTPVTVSIVEAAGDVGVFVSVQASLSEQQRTELAAAVRLAVAGRKDFTEDPRIIIGDTR